MGEAIAMAQEAAGAGEVPVGCVIVHRRGQGGEDSRVIASGRNRTNESKDATRHAEFEAYDDLLSSVSGDTARVSTAPPCSLLDVLTVTQAAALLSDSSLFVTVEPFAAPATPVRGTRA